jgi:hypothetical protein
MPLTSRKRLTLQSPAHYRIKVQGLLEDVWSDRLGGMRIITSTSDENNPITTVSGLLRDQAELVGVLNGLYELRLPLLSVEIINGDN